MSGENPAGDPPEPLGRAQLKLITPFLVLPLAFLLAAFLFSRIVGPFYFAYNYDPDYVYLLNGLNLAILQSPEHTDHPGTPLQLLLGLGIRLVNAGIPAPETAANVIAHAEDYLSVANLLIVLAYAAVLVWAGLAVARRTGSRAAGWMIQATPFFLGDGFLMLLRVNPEPMLLMASLALAPFLADGRPATSGAWSRRLLLSLLVATGLCLKVTFLPVLVVVLWLEQGWRNRLWLAGLIVVWSLLWTIPIWSKYARLFGWYWGLAARQGPYGLGPTGLISFQSYLSGLATLVWANKIYSMSLLAGFGTLLLIRSRNVHNRGEPIPHVRLLACLLAGGLLQFLISAKNPQSRYLAPSLGLMGLNWAVVVLLLVRVDWLGTPARRIQVFRSIAGLTALMVLIQLTTLYRRMVRNEEGRSGMSRVTSEQQQGARIFYYGASSPVNALTFSTYFAGQQYYRIVEKLIRSGTCETYVYNNFTGDFYSLRGRASLDRMLAAGGPVLLQGDVLSEPEQKLLPPDVELRVVRQFEDERIYEIRRKTPAGDGSRR